MQASFGNVTTAGAFASSFQEATTIDQINQILGPRVAAQINFGLTGAPYQVWNSEFTGLFTGDVTMVLHFDPAFVKSFSLSLLEIAHYENGDWVIPPNQVIDPVADTITFTTDSFSAFLLAEVPEPSSVVLLSIGAIGLAVVARMKIRKRAA